MSLGARVRGVADRAWYSPGIGASSLRYALAPLSGLFGAVVKRRNVRYDDAVARGILPATAVPAMSVGNLTVGGTGKTPVASWFAARLRARGAAPALLLRGYGDDEWRVHELLTPDVPVILNPDRVAGLAEAKDRGADCAVLDDAFQHRRARRVSDVVLVSADRFDPAVRLLPAGPYREPLASLGRATAVLITVKAAGDEQVQRTVVAVRAAAPAVPLAVVRLVPEAIRDLHGGGAETAQTWLAGRPVVLASALADPVAFGAQVEAAGARILAHHQFPDHHAFTAGEVEALVRAGQATGGVLCTLKDAVKLGPLWPRVGPPLWYVSQTLVVDRGAEVLEQECDRVLVARMTESPTAG
jgi:tetraacyldisaccharide 4'-kinase